MAEGPQKPSANVRMFACLQPVGTGLCRLTQQFHGAHRYTRARFCRTAGISPFSARGYFPKAAQSLHNPCTAKEKTRRVAPSRPFAPSKWTHLAEVLGLSSRHDGETPSLRKLQPGSRFGVQPAKSKSITFCRKHTFPRRTLKLYHPLPPCVNCRARPNWRVLLPGGWKIESDPCLGRLPI